MRTTITLDDDLARKLNDRAHRQRTSFKEAVNEVIRIGLSSESKPKRLEHRFSVEPIHSEFEPGVDRARLNQLVDELEARERCREAAAL